MTMFWWARALKASHMEQARGYLNAYARGAAGRETLEIAFGHMRAVPAIEASVEKEPDTLRAHNANALDLNTPLWIGKMIDANEGYLSAAIHQRAERKLVVLELFESFEQENLHIIYS